MDIFILLFIALYKHRTILLRLNYLFTVCAVIPVDVASTIIDIVSITHFYIYIFYRVYASIHGFVP